MKPINKFKVDTKGICFVCLGERVSPRSRSFLGISRFLKFNYATVFSLSKDQGGWRKEEDLEDTEVFVPLCDECAPMVTDFDQMYRELQLIRLKMHARVKTIHERMTEAEGDKDRFEEYKGRLMTTKNPFERICANIVDNLRKETITKCSAKIQVAFPTVKLNRIKATPNAKKETRLEDDCENETVSPGSTVRDLAVESKPATMKRRNGTNMMEHPDEVEVQAVNEEACTNDKSGGSFHNRQSSDLEQQLEKDSAEILTKYLCDSCPTELNSTQDLQMHKAELHYERPVIVMPTKSQLDLEILSKDLEEQQARNSSIPLACIFCKSFYRKSDKLREHLIYNHNDKLSIASLKKLKSQMHVVKNVKAGRTLGTNVPRSIAKKKLKVVRNPRNKYKNLYLDSPHLISSGKCLQDADIRSAAHSTRLHTAKNEGAPLKTPPPFNKDVVLAAAPPPAKNEGAFSKTPPPLKNDVVPPAAPPPAKNDVLPPKKFSPAVGIPPIKTDVVTPEQSLPDTPKIIASLRYPPTKNMDSPPAASAISPPAKFPTVKNEFICTICSQSFPYSKDLQFHTMKHHLTTIFSSMRDPSMSPVDFQAAVHHLFDKAEQPSSNSENPYDCTYCSAKFGYRKFLRYHLIDKHLEELKGDLKNQLVPSSSPPSSESESDSASGYSSSSSSEDSLFSLVAAPKRKRTAGKGVTCDTCGKSFSNKYTLQVHARVHTGEKPYKCIYCQLGFEFSTPFQTHVANKHLGDAFKNCKSKGQSEDDFTVDVVSLVKERITALPNEKRFCCTICSKKYRLKAVCKYHLITTHHRDLAGMLKKEGIPHKKDESPSPPLKKRGRPPKKQKT